MEHKYKLDTDKQSAFGDTARRPDRAIIDICVENSAVLVTAFPDQKDNCWYFTTDRELVTRPEFVEVVQNG